MQKWKKSVSERKCGLAGLNTCVEQFKVGGIGGKEEGEEDGGGVLVVEACSSSCGE